MRRAVAATVLILGAASAANAASGDPHENPSVDIRAYAGWIERYRKGDGAVLEEVAAQDPRAMGGAIREVERATPNDDDGPPSARGVRAVFPTAVMLHTEAGLFLNWRGDGARAFQQWQHARRLSELAPVTAEQTAFLRAWYGAFGAYFLGSTYLDDASSLLERGAKRFPEDKAIALLRAEVYDAKGVCEEEGAGSDGPRLTPLAGADFATAAALYRELMAGDPPSIEAKLRLGRVLALTGHSDEALVQFREVAARTDVPRLAYLSHLFTGEILRRALRVSKAKDEFVLALHAFPSGQAAALGLAEALHTLGDVGGSAATLATTIGGEESAPVDPYRTYVFGDHDEQKRRLQELKAMALGLTPSSG
jgi:tetratricopeptide (TPR) repeat protein